MTDPTKEPAGSLPSGPTAGIPQLPKSTQLTFSQHVFIWLLIVVVGVLFGMGGSMGSLMAPSQDSHGVSQREIEVRRDVDTRLGKVLNNPRQQTNDDYAKFIKLVWVAQKAGLQPSGHALDQLVDDFLDHDLGQGRTVRAALIDAQGSDNEVTHDELKRTIAEDAAVEAFRERHNAVPAVPLGAGAGLDMVDNDKIQVQSALLNASSLLQPVKPDDPEIQTTYETLRSQGKFTQQPTETVTVAYGDMPALISAAKAAITPAQIQAYYDAHKAEPRFAQPAAAPAPSTTPAKPGTPPVAAPAPIPKPLAQVRPEIIQTLAEEQAVRQAKAATKALDADAEDLEGQKDNLSFIDEAKKLGLAVKTNLVIEQPTRDPMMERYAQYMGSQPLMIELAGLGQLRDEAGLFNADKEPGFISRPLTASQGPLEVPLMLRLETRTEAGFKPLSAVKNEVIRHLQGNRAYAPFMAAVEQVRDAAQKLGPNGLSTYLSSPAGRGWHAQVSSETLPASQMLTPPPASLGLTPPDGHVAASLALADHPILVAADDEDADSDIPQVKLLQSSGYVSAPATAALDKRAKLAHQYRDALKNFSYTLFQPEMTKITQ